MEQRKLKDCIQLTLGPNLAKAKEELEDYEALYDQAAFTADLNHVETYTPTCFPIEDIDPAIVQTGEIVISNALKLAAIVSPENNGKRLTNNFIRASVLTDSVDPLDNYYFLYLFNESRQLAKQKERELQGIAGVQRIPVSAYESMLLPIVSKEEQQKIGKVYIETKKVKQQLQHYAKTIEDFSFSIIDQQIEKKA